MIAFKSQKLIIAFIATLLIISINIVKSKNSSDNDDEGTTFHFSFGDSDTPRNYSESKAFRILKSAPWSKMEELQDKYDKLRRNYRNKKDKLEEVERAFTMFANKYKEGTFKEKSFYEVLFKGFQDFVVLEGIFGLFFLFSFLAYKFQKYANAFIFYQVVSFIILERFFPHYFSYTWQQYSVAFVLGCILTFRGKIFQLILGKDNNQVQNNAPAAN